MAKKGGKQPGAGRPKGSKNLYSMQDYFSKKDVDTFVEFLKANYMEDTKLMVWLGEHLFGKPSQAVDVTTNGKDLPVPIISLTKEQ